MIFSSFDTKTPTGSNWSETILFMFRINRMSLYGDRGIIHKQIEYRVRNIVVYSSTLLILKDSEKSKQSFYFHSLCSTAIINSRNS